MERFTNQDQVIENSQTVLWELMEQLNRLPTLSLADLKKEETALAIVDVVNGFAKEGLLSSPRIQGIISPIAEMLEKFKEKDMTVVAFADSHTSDSVELKNYVQHCIAGTYESEIVEEIQQIGGYTNFPKNSTNGFLEEDFQQWYAQHENIKNWIVTGDCTDICILNFALTLKNDYNRKNKESRVIVPLHIVETYHSKGHDADFMNLASAMIMLNQGIELVRSVQ